MIKYLASEELDTCWSNIVFPATEVRYGAAALPVYSYIKCLLPEQISNHTITRVLESKPHTSIEKTVRHKI